MRIISNYSDYYDVVQAQGQDLSLVYLRSPIDETWQYKPDHKYARNNIGPFPVFGGHWCQQITIGFCGRIYPLLSVDIPWDVLVRQRASRNELDIVTHVLCYTLEELDAFVEKYYKANAVAGYYAKAKEVSKYWSSGNKRTAFKKFFDECAAKRDAFRQFFIDHHCPIFVVQHGSCKTTVTYNAQLKQYKFYKIVPTAQAYQEIAMFWGSLAHPNRPIPAVSDKDMVVAKGFDKSSFRKEPTKKRRR